MGAAGAEESLSLRLPDELGFLERVGEGEVKSGELEDFFFAKHFFISNAQKRLKAEGM